MIRNTEVAKRYSYKPEIILADPKVKQAINRTAPNKAIYLTCLP